MKAAELKEKAKKFCADRQAANEIVEVMAVVTETAAAGGGGGAAGAGAESPGDVATLLAGISSILKMTTHVIENGVASLSSSAKDQDPKEDKGKRIVSFC